MEMLGKHNGLLDALFHNAANVRKDALRQAALALQERGSCSGSSSQGRGRDCVIMAPEKAKNLRLEKHHAASSCLDFRNTLRVTPTSMSNLCRNICRTYGNLLEFNTIPMQYQCQYKYNTVPTQHKTVQYRHNAILGQYNTNTIIIQYHISAIQYDTIPYDTIQYQCQTPNTSTIQVPTQYNANTCHEKPLEAEMGIICTSINSVHHLSDLQAKGDHTNIMQTVETPQRLPQVMEIFACMPACCC